MFVIYVLKKNLIYLVLKLTRFVRKYIFVGVKIMSQRCRSRSTGHL